MTGESSLPPLKKNEGKYALIAILLALGAGGLWFYWSDDEAEPAPEVAEPSPEPPSREQFVPAIEIPEEAEETLPEEPAEPADLPREPDADAPEDWVCNGSIDAANVRTAIKGAPSKQVQTCYERGLKSNNLLQGSMDVELTIGGDGSVRAVLVRGTLDDRRVASCVKRVARTWKFPPPTGGCVRVAVPFQLTPKL